MKSLPFTYKSSLFLSFFLLINGFLIAQKTISGIVKDKNTPLEGVAIVVKNTTIGAVTDAEGRFSMSVPDSAKILITTYVGYLPQEVKIKNNVTIELEINTSFICTDAPIIATLEQIAYAQQTTPSLWIAQKRFNEGNINDPLALIQNKAAGLSISKVGSNPNEPYFSQIRSLHNLMELSSPLVVLDGVPNTPLSIIDPKDIESIEVLKDGAASARWGMQASGGVLNVRSKSGGFTPLSISYSPQLSVESISNSHQNLSADDYILANGVNLNSSQDWLKNVSRTAFSHAQNLTLGGSSNGSNYRIALNYRNAQGIQLNDGFEQVNSLFKFGQKLLNDKLHIQLQAAYTQRKSRFAEEEAFRYAMTHNPTAPVEDPKNTANGGFFEIQGFDDFNPVSILKQSKREGKQTHYLAQLQASYELLNNLTINALGNIYQSDEERGEDYQKQAKFRGQFDAGLAVFETDKRDRQFFNAFGKYVFNKKSLSINTQIGYDYQDFSQKTKRTNASQFFSNDLISYKDLSGAFRKVIDTLQAESRLVAFYGQTHISWNNIIDADFSLRREGSTRLATGKKWGWLPAMGVGIKLHQLLSLQGVNMLRVRGSWSISGNLPLQTGLSQNVFGNSFNKEPNLIKNGNPDLTFEKKTEWNVGADIAFWNNRIRITADYYQRQMTDLIYLFDRLPSGLFNSQSIFFNAGAVSASGTEGGISAAIFEKKAFKWTTELNVTTFNNRLNTLRTTVLGLPEGGLKTGSPGPPCGCNTLIAVVKEGLPIGNLYAPRFAGVDERGISNVLDEQGNRVTFTDFGNPISALPKWSLGWNNYFTLKKWDAHMSIRGVFGHKLANLYRLMYENDASTLAWNRIKTDKATFGVKDLRWSDNYIENGDFLKLDNLSVGYNFDINRLKMRVFVASNNVFTITNYTGADPSVRYSYTGPTDNGGRSFRERNPDPLIVGIDNRKFYPPTRSWTLGAHLNF